MIASSARAGAERIQLRTDGGGLAEPGNAPGALAAGVTHVEVELLAGDAAIHDALTGRPGLFDACREGLAALTVAAERSGADVAITGAVPVCRHNLEHLASAIVALAEMGAVSVVLEVSPAAASSTALPAALASALETGTINRVWVTVAGVDPERVPLSHTHLVAPFTVARASAVSAS